MPRFQFNPKIQSSLQADDDGTFPVWGSTNYSLKSERRQNKSFRPLGTFSRGILSGLKAKHGSLFLGVHPPNERISKYFDEGDKDVPGICLREETGLDSTMDGTSENDLDTASHETRSTDSPSFHVSSDASSKDSGGSIASATVLSMSSAFNTSDQQSSTCANQRNDEVEICPDPTPDHVPTEKLQCSSFPGFHVSSDASSKASCGSRVSASVLSVSSAFNASGQQSSTRANEGNDEVEICLDPTPDHVPTEELQCSSILPGAIEDTSDALPCCLLSYMQSCPKSATEDTFVPVAHVFFPDGDSDQSVVSEMTRNYVVEILTTITDKTRVQNTLELVFGGEEDEEEIAKATGLLQCKEQPSKRSPRDGANVKDLIAKFENLSKSSHRGVLKVKALIEKFEQLAKSNSF